MSELLLSEAFLEQDIPLDIRQEAAAAGAVLMARDAALLERAATNSTKPVVRFYEWIQPTVSLGFHQKKEILDKEALDRERISWVRRPTGGAAVLHSQELTYALVLPPKHPFLIEKSVLEHVGKALTRGLRALGIAAKALHRSNPLERLPDRASCFVRSSRWEVCVRGKKIVGSAQRILNGALLQHGSIMCGPDHLRLISVLRLSSEEVRSALLSRVKAASTSIAEELGHPIHMTLLRQEMAQAFRDEFEQVESVREFQ